VKTIAVRFDDPAGLNPGDGLISGSLLLVTEAKDMDSVSSLIQLFKFPCEVFHMYARSSVNIRRIFLCQNRDVHEFFKSFLAQPGACPVAADESNRRAGASLPRVSFRYSRFRVPCTRGLKNPVKSPVNRRYVYFSGEKSGRCLLGTAFLLGCLCPRNRYPLLILRNAIVVFFQAGPRKSSLTFSTAASRQRPACGSPGRTGHCGLAKDPAVDSLFGKVAKGWARRKGIRNSTLNPCGTRMR
jgi:hypothetical protein